MALERQNDIHINVTALMVTREEAINKAAQQLARAENSVTNLHAMECYISMASNWISIAQLLAERSPK